jgi:hypothetical protein
LKIVGALGRRCQLGTDRLNLDGDPVGRSRPGSAKGATEVRVLLLELAVRPTGEEASRPGTVWSSTTIYEGFS